MKGPKLSEHQLRVLAEGILNKGVFQTELVYKLYSSDDAAKNCILSLESWGYIRLHPTAMGWMQVIKAPDEAFIIAENLKEARSKEVKEIEKEDSDIDIV